MNNYYNNIYVYIFKLYKKKWLKVLFLIFTIFLISYLLRTTSTLLNYFFCKYLC